MSRKYLDFITRHFCNVSLHNSSFYYSFYLDLPLFTFLLLRQKKSNKRKGDFIPNAPQE